MDPEKHLRPLRTKRDASAGSTWLFVGPTHRSPYKVEACTIDLECETSVERTVLAVALPVVTDQVT